MSKRIKYNVVRLNEPSEKAKEHLKYIITRLAYNSIIAETKMENQENSNLCVNCIISCNLKDN